MKLKGSTWEHARLTSARCAHESSIYLYMACLSVCLYPINVKTAEPIGSKFKGPDMIQGKVCGWLELKKFRLI